VTVFFSYFRVSENANLNTDSFTTSHSYKIPTGGANANLFFTGSTYFKVAEIEHFATSPIDKYNLKKNLYSI